MNHSRNWRLNLSLSMRIRSLAIAIIVLSAHEAAAQSTALRVMASNGVKAAMNELRAQSERAIGRPLAIEY